jgi:hypothetical protein
MFKKERDCVVQEFMKAQDTIAQLKLNKMSSSKSYEGNSDCNMNNNFELMNKKISKSFM